MVKLSESADERISHIHASQWLIWGVMTVLPGALVLVARTTSAPRYEPVQDATQLIFMVVAVTAALSLGSFIIRSFARTRRATQMAVTYAENFAKHGLPDKNLPRDLSPLEIRLFTALSWFTLFFILPLVLNEAIAVLGLALALVQSRPQALYPYAGAAVILNFVCTPQGEKLEKRIIEILEISLGH